MRLNVLLLSPYFAPTVGGVETHLTDLCKYLSDKKHTVYVRTYQTLGTRIKGKEHEDSNYLHIHRMWWPDFNLIYSLEKYPILKFSYIFSGLFFDSFFFLTSNRSKVSVIQAHGFIAACIGVLLGKLYKKRVVVNTHVGFNLKNRGLIASILRNVLLNADEVLVLTHSAKDALVDLGILEEKITIYHYWVDQKNFIPKKKTLASKKHTFTVLFVGRLIEVKGINTVLSLAQSLKNVHFVIAGSGPMAHHIQEAALRNKNITFVGSVQHDQLPGYYRSSDILLIPSKIIKQEYEEGIPRVMIEALSCGLPVLSTPSGGIPDVFSEKIGQIVSDNLKDITQKINYFKTHSDQLRNRAQNCRAFAIKYFSIKNADIMLRSLTK